MAPAAPRVWDLTPQSADRALLLCRRLGIQPLTARILVARGVTDPDEAERFLNPSFDQLHDPNLMKGMDRAIHRTLEAFRDSDPILVYGDSDVDGVTAASSVYQFLKRLGVEVDYAIPSRTDEGYGLTCSTVHQAAEAGTRLIITTDCGIGNLESISLARDAYGIDVIVIDHHTLPEVLPPARAILNPLQPGCRYPFKRLAAVGVVFNYLMALNSALEHHGAFPSGAPDLIEYLDIVALGTVADAVPLLDVNRVFVRVGLEVLRRRRRAGIQALMERAQVEGRPVTARTIGYRLAPLLNAAGRMGDARRCVTLLTTESYRQAIRLARELEEDNTLRQKAEREMLTEATAMAEEAFDQGRSLLMLSAEGWHEGVLGIVASRIKELYHLPAAMVAINKETGRARVSLRASKGIDLIAAMTPLADKLISFGGHTAAAGMTLAATDLDEVRDAMNALIEEQLRSTPGPALSIDTGCSLAELDHLFTRELLDLAPFGVAHPEPVVLASSLRCVRKRVLGDKHLRVQLREGDASFEAIGFALASRAPLLDKPVDVALTPRHSLYCGKPKLEIQLKDLRHHQYPEA